MSERIHPNSLIHHTLQRVAEETHPRTSALSRASKEELKDKVKELQEKVSKLERFHDATIDQELRMKELKSEIEKLENKLIERK